MGKSSQPVGSVAVSYRLVCVVFAGLVAACVGAGSRPGPGAEATAPGSVAGAGDPYEWRLPPGFPKPEVPEDNPMSSAKVELGRRLFYDARLSGNGHFSCASCHRQELAFTDGRARAVGSTGELHSRSSMSLSNVAYNATYNWADPEITRLEHQALNPMLNQDPIELGIAGREREILERLRLDEGLAALFELAFPDRQISIETITYALASFERTLISGSSPYDRFLFFGEPLGESARGGMELFFSARTRCSACHAGLNLSGPVRIARAAAPQAEFHNTGLFDLDGKGAYPAPNRGVFEVTGLGEDMGRFRAPSLRNIEVTAPYMHDGSIESLGEVVDFYAAGGRDAGRVSPRKSPLVAGFELTAAERSDLIAFLEVLTDRDFLEDSRFGPPA